ncbi:MAG: hypothetical protein WBX25_24580 [Rhodomicrobium sp.]
MPHQDSATPLDITAYPYLPKANVGATRAADYTALLDRAAA